MTERVAGDRGGFTLLELVLALTSLALLAGICYGAFHLGLRAVQKGEVAVVVAQRLRVASDVMIRQIKSTVAYPVRNRDDDIYPFFMGNAASLTFVTTAGLQQGVGLTRVIYRVLDDPPRLMVEESTGFTNDSLGRQSLDQPGDRASVLLDGFKSLSFTYLYNDGGDVEPRPLWDGRAEEMLPSAVRVTVQGMPGLETDLWGQDIPIMRAMIGDDLGEVGEERWPFVRDDDGAPGDPDEGDYPQDDSGSDGAGEE